MWIWSTSWSLASSVNSKWVTLASYISSSKFISRGIGGCAPSPCINKTTSTSFWSDLAWMIASPSQPARHQDLISEAFRGRVWRAFTRNKRHSVSRGGGIIYVRNGGHKTKPCIDNKHDKPVYVEAMSDALDGHQTNHAVFEGHIGYEVAYWRPTYRHKMLFRCRLGRRYGKPKVHLQIRFLC